MLSVIKANVGKVGKAVLKQKLKKEYDAQSYIPNERAIEYRFVFQSIHKTSPKTVLDIGTGLTALPHLMSSCGLIVTAIDNIYEYWSKGGMFNRHFHLISDDITTSKLKGQWDLITCISTLEHIKNYEAAVKHMFALLKPKGHLVLTFPYNEREYVANAYTLPGAAVNKNISYICQVYSREQLEVWLTQNGGRIIDQEYWKCYEGDFWTLGTKIHPPLQVKKEEKHQLSCILIQKD